LAVYLGFAIKYPSIFRHSTIRPQRADDFDATPTEASKAQNSIAAVSAEGSMVWVLIRRLNSSCRHSIAFDVRIDFHWLFGPCEGEQLVAGFL
jgi:hypothetical protein